MSVNGATLNSVIDRMDFDPRSGQTKDYKN